MRALGRLDLVQPHHAALGLRDDLLGDDEDVCVLEPARPLGRLGQKCDEIVALPRPPGCPSSGMTLMPVVTRGR